MKTKYIALVLSIADKKPMVHPVFENDTGLKYFDDADQAEKYIKKYCHESEVFYGLIDDPRPYHKVLHKDYVKENK